jgi:hypothetical protein
MDKVISSELKFWKLALRETYYLGLITEVDLIRMHTSAFYNTISDENHKDSSQIEVVLSVMDNTDLFANLIKEEVDIISKGTLPDDKRTFKKMWVSYLLDCLDESYITDGEFEVYYDSIEFNGSTWTADERESAQDVVEIVRFMLLHQNPNMIEYIENPSFDMLMYANDLEYV